MRLRKLKECDKSHIDHFKSIKTDSQECRTEFASRSKRRNEISRRATAWTPVCMRNAGIPGFVFVFIATVLIVHASQSSGLVIPQSNKTASVSSFTFPYPTVGSHHYTNSSSPTLLTPRRLSRLPKSRRNAYSGSSPPLNKPTRFPIPVESAKSRARLLLGSLNRQNCFAKVLCGLGARAPTTKTDLVNDYVYLMEELMVDDEDDDDDGKKSPGRGKGKKKKKKNKDGKPVFKNDNSDSSQSEEDDENSPLGFMAEGELAAEDPEVLKYVRLEQKRRKYKDSLPKTNTGTLSSLFSKRQGKDDTVNNVTVTNDENAPLSSNSTAFRTKQHAHRLRRAKQLVRQVKNAVKTGRTLGNSRQCRTIFDRCPFDEIQMNEIVTNLRKMMQGQTVPTAAAAATPSKTVSASVISNQASPSGSSGVISQAQNTGGPGSKVEIVLHLNQNGLPYNHGLQYMQPYGIPGYPVGGVSQLPAASFSSPAGTGSSVPGTHVEGPKPQPPLVSAAPLIPTTPVASLPPSPTVAQPGNPPPGSSIVPLVAPEATAPPTQTTTTTATTTTEGTTVRSVGEEQLLDFLYGAVNFNESDPVGIQPHADIPPNPFWSTLAEAIPDPFADDFEQQLKVRSKQNKKKFPVWNADGDDDDDSKSSEEMQLKNYLVSLRETLQGLAQMNNATLAVETKVVKNSSEEDDDSVGDPLDDDLTLPGIAEVEDESEEDEEDEPSSKDKEVNLNTKGKKKNSNKNKKPPKTQKKKPKPLSPSPDTNILIAAPSPKTTKKPVSTKKPPPPVQSGESGEPLFDDDEEENNDDLSSPSFGPGQQIGSNSGGGRPNRPNNRPPQDDDEFEAEQSGENNSSGGNHQDDEGEPSFEEPSNEESEEASKKPKKKKPTRPPKITLKFDPEEPMKEDMDDMTPKEKRKLFALTNALLPPQRPVGPVSPEKLKPPVDFLEEIRIPTQNPVADEFQAVAKLAKSTEVINIDEFAEDSGKDPTFPKKSTKNNKKRRNRIRYQNRRRPAPTRPLFQRDGDRLRPAGGVHSSEEDSSGFGRAESLEIQGNNGGPLIARPFHGPPNFDGPQQFDIFGSMMNMMGLKPVDNPHFRADPNDAMERHPLVYQGSDEAPSSFPPPSNQPPLPSFTRQEHFRPVKNNNEPVKNNNEPVDDRAKMSIDDLPTPGEAYKFTIKPADPKISINIPMDDNIYKQPHDINHSKPGPPHQSSYPPPPPSHNRHPSGPPGSQSDDDNDEYSDEEPYDYVQPNPAAVAGGGGPDRPELDLPPTAPDAKKKGEDGPFDDEKKDEDDHEDHDKKKKGKKKKKDHKKKDHKKKDHDKKKKKDKKKHHKGWGHHGYSQQFHQQVFPAPEKKDHGIWAKIKNELGAIASGFGDTEKDGWVSFIDLGFKDTNKEGEGNPGHPAIGPHVNTYGPPPHGHHIHNGDDDNSRSDEEEDDLAGPGKDSPQDDGEDDEDDDDGSSEGDDEDEEEDENSEDEDKGKEKVKEGNNNEGSGGGGGGESQGAPAAASGESESGAATPGAAGTMSPVQAPAIQQGDTAGSGGVSTTPKITEDEAADSGEKAESTTTTKSPIAPKPPKYQVKRNRNKVRGKKKKKPQPSKGPPITLFVSTTEKPPSTTATPTDAPRSKPPKRRILYKPPSAKVHTPPGTPLNTVTTAKPLPPPKSSKTKNKGGLYHEDDEVEHPSVFFQPGPNGQNIRGKPPIPIDAFHIQSEDMLEDPDLRRRSALGVRADGSDEEESGEDEEDEEDGGNSSGQNRRVIQYKPSGGMGSAPISIEALYRASEDSEEMRGGGKKNKKGGNRRYPPPGRPSEGPFTQSNPYGAGGDSQPQPSAITSAVMNSAIFSNHFKHLYTKVQDFGQSFMNQRQRPATSLGQPFR